jgi:hypothetical protein
MSQQNPRSRAYAAPRQDTMADILERVLDTGVVIAGDIRVQLADIELLTIQIRLVICSVDKAQEMGMDWWKSAPFLSSGGAQGALDTEQITASARLLEAERAERRLESELQRKQMEALDARLERLERAIEALASFGAERG